MTDEIAIGTSGRGKIREFWTGFALAAITLGIYEIWWYYRLNDELRAIGRERGDERLSRSLPAVSATAIALALAAFVPDATSTGLAIGLFVVVMISWASQARFGRRIAHAEELYGIPADQRFNSWAFLLLFPGGLFVIPYFLWFAYVTRHQNELLELVDTPWRAPVAA